MSIHAIIRSHNTLKDEATHNICLHRHILKIQGTLYITLKTCTLYTNNEYANKQL